MEKTNVRKQFTESQNSEISRILNTLESFAKEEITKLRSKHLIIKRDYGYSLGFYEIIEDNSYFEVRTQAGDNLGVFPSLNFAVFYALLISKNQFDIADKINSASQLHISSQIEIKFYKEKLSAFNNKKIKDWWQFDLYHSKIAESENKLKISKSQLKELIDDSKWIIRKLNVISK
jgi:hypothetical protein